MIVNSLDDGWEVIYQRSHANLAAMLVANWRSADQPKRFTELIIATAQHDDQEMFWDRSRHLTELGAPLDFTQADLDTSRIEARAVIDNAYRQGLWIALLISRHNSFLYEPKRGQDAELDKFLDEQRENQKAWRRSLGMTKEEQERVYALLGWGDRLSLILCRREVPERDRLIDISPGPDGTMIRVGQREDGTLRLEPWVFDTDQLIFSVETRLLRQLKFGDEAEFLAVMDAAEIHQREWHFHK